MENCLLFGSNILTILELHVHNEKDILCNSNFPLITLQVSPLAPYVQTQQNRQTH